jgi:hypothetical protein
MDKSKIKKEIVALIDSIKEHSGKLDTESAAEQKQVFDKVVELYHQFIVYNHLTSLPDKVSSQEKASEDKKIVAAPIDLFGEEVPATPKVKQEKKAEKKEEKSVEVAPPSKPTIDDINKAIAVNDKFLFANELFAGSMQEYNIAIHQFNTAGTLESAMDYFSNLQELYGWNLENDTIKRLLELIDKRYS